MTSLGKTCGARFLSSLYSINAATCHRNVNTLPDSFRLVSFTHLPDESKRGLVQTLLLRVPNVRGDDLAKRKSTVHRVFLQLDTVFLRLDSEFATYSILYVADGRVEGVNGEFAHE
jgi:hypothetical protein